jgi:putative transposase
MRTGRPKKAIILSEEEEEQLKFISSSHSLPFALVTRAKIIIMSAQGKTNKAIPVKLDCSPQSVSLWRKRFLEQGIQGLHDELEPGRPRSISNEQVAELIQKTLQTKPKGCTHWTTRSMAEDIQISHQTVQRIWNAFGVQPHR